MRILQLVYSLRKQLHEEGIAIRHLFSDHPKFGKLLELSTEWSRLVGGQNLSTIEERCRSRLKDSTASTDARDHKEDYDGDDDSATEPFSLEACNGLFIDHFH